jgi:cytochrome c oxidase assembly protein subunit 15
MNAAGFDFSPLAQMAVLGALLAALAGVWLWWRRKPGANLLAALTVLTLFLTFDLVVFGAFTRLTDSGLGCPDWPGCYGNASPIGAQAQIAAAQAAMPTGPVTHGKAWIEIVHRYLAGGVGMLCLALCVLTWWRRSTVSPWWATATLAWVCVQIVFGALTVTMKLFPAIVTTHLLLGLGLLALLAWQAVAYAPEPLRLSPGLHRAAWALLALAVAQIALGGWVSTNYAVLACSDFPACQSGQWWPEADFAQGFSLWRHLGLNADGGLLPFAALTAIHLAHRMGALIVLPSLLLFSLALWRAGVLAWARRLAGVAAWQLATGLSNVVLGWPLLAALGHTAGAALLITFLSLFLARARQGRT